MAAFGIGSGQAVIACPAKVAAGSLYIGFAGALLGTTVVLAACNIRGNVLSNCGILLNFAAFSREKRTFTVRQCPVLVAETALPVERADARWRHGESVLALLAFVAGSVASAGVAHPCLGVAAALAGGGAWDALLGVEGGTGVPWGAFLAGQAAEVSGTVALFDRCRWLSPWM